MNKTLLSLACLVFLAGLSGGVSAESNPFCVNWQNETTVPGGGNSPNIIRLDNGTLFLASNGILASKSTDNGTTWGNRFNVASGGGLTLDPSCIQLGNSRILCTYSVDDSTIWTTYSDDYGDHWSASVNVTPGGLRYGHAFVPDLLELDNGDILLGFTDGQLFTVGGVKVMKSTDGGNSWSAPVWIWDGGGGYSSKVDLLQLNDGSILAGFYEGVEPEISSLNISKSYDNGMTWTIVAPSVASYPDARWVSLLQLNNGEVWAAFNGLELVKSYDGGMTWQYRQPITAGFWPSLIQLPDNTVITAFATAPFPSPADIHIIKGFEADCPPFTLTVGIYGGAGTVISSPAGIDCGTDCSEVYSAGTTVTLTPIPAADMVFHGWIGDPECLDGIVNMKGDTFCYAYFLSNVSFTITAPNGGENWKAGSTHPITWTYTGNPGAFVKIELRRKDPNDFYNYILVSTLAKSAPIGVNGTGSYNWKIPKSMKTGSDYKIFIRSTSNNSYVDSSDSLFTISK